MIAQHLRASLALILGFTMLTGVLYPILVTGLSQLLFAEKASGSLILGAGKMVGSELIGQSFAGPGYFLGRPSATPSFPYNAASSTGSNYGPLNPALRTSVGARIVELKALDPENRAPVPVDLVTASGSGLDPHISIASALYQLQRVSRVRGISADSILILISRNTEGRDLGVLGEPRVNVLRLNIALDLMTIAARRQ
jgi:potassium-transporting ATPase KdpC subunit